ncbi:MAG TPA: IclR family transcriptional regulator [Solirubrobacteraceae bacterium]|nr:IclR family transcriptional regulator [Solirubrobacteraceae bacterium]
MKDTPSTAPPVQAVARAFALLEELAAQEEAGLAELARRVGLHPSTTHRLLASLIDCGYAGQSRVTGRYRLSRKVLELSTGSRALDAHLRTVARPHLQAIRTEIDETTNLVALEGMSAVYLEQAESRRAVRLFAEPGRRVPAHASGAGKAMLAFQEPAVLERLYASGPWEQLTASTITSVADLHEELQRIRRRGYAIDSEEYEDGVSCVAAPVFDPGGQVGAAVSVSAPSARLARWGFDALGRLLARHAGEIADELR